MILPSAPPRSLFARLRRFPDGARDGMLAFVLVLLVVAAAGTIAAQSRVMPAGDTFNFIQGARALGRGTYPSDEKRLPLYPLLILVGERLGGDPVVVARSISTVAFALAFGALYLLGRRLQLAPLPLWLLLTLGAVQPVQLGNGIRELADSLFLFLFVCALLCAVSVRRSRGWLFGTAGVFALLALTRYEGVLAVGMLLLFLRMRLPWKSVFVVGGITFVLLLPWGLVMTRLYGAPWRLSYFHCVEQCGYGAGVSEVPTRLYQLLDMTGWTKAWKTPQFLIEQARADASRHVLPELVRSSAWWTVVFGLLGVLWLLGTRARRHAALPVLLTLATVGLSVAWWKLHGRFTIVSLLLFSFLSAAGAAAVWTMAQRLTRRSVVLRTGLSLLLVVLFLALVRQEFSGLFSGAVTRVFGYQGNGYALYLATEALAREEGGIVFRRDYPMGLVYLHSSYTPGGLRGIFVDMEYPDLSLPALVDVLQQRAPTWVMVDGTERMEVLADALRAGGQVTEERVYRARRGPGGRAGEESVTVLRLSWDRRALR